MIQPLRQHVKYNNIVKKRCIIFWCDGLKREGLPDLEWPDAEDRKDDAIDLFKEVIQIEPIEDHHNPTKAQIIARLEEVNEEAKAFEESKENPVNKYTWNGVFVHFIGYSCNPKDNPYMNNFGLDEALTYPNLIFCGDGEALCINEYLLKIADNPHT